jgi:hypothetical protein
MTPSSPLSVIRRFGGTYRLHLQGRKISWPKTSKQAGGEHILLAICSLVGSFETSVETQRTTRRHTPKDDTLHNHRCENIKSYNGKFVLFLSLLHKIKFVEFATWRLIKCSLKVTYQRKRETRNWSVHNCNFLQKRIWFSKSDSDGNGLNLAYIFSVLLDTRN